MCTDKWVFLSHLSFVNYSLELVFALEHFFFSKSVDTMQNDVMAET